MSIEFNKISGGKFNFIKDDEVRNRMDEAGRKVIIFVEGSTDERIFHILFNDVLIDKVAYISAGTYSKVKEYLKGTLDKNIEGFLGIIDRDFKTDEERDQLIAEFNRKLYIHKRYAIENYLIEKDILLEMIKDIDRTKEISLDEVSEIITKILKDLTIVMAGNMILYGYSACYLNKSILCKKDIVLRKVLDNLASKVTNCEIDEEHKEAVERLYIAKLENLIEKQDNINELHKIVNGKYFFYNFKHELKNRWEVTNFNDDDKEKFSLARIAKHKGLNDEVIEIRDFIQNSIA